MIQILLQILMHLQQGYMREGKGPIYCDIRPCWYYPLLLPYSVKQHMDLSQSSPNWQNLSYCTTAVITVHPVPSVAATFVYLGTVPTTPAACATFAASELLATSTTPTAITPAASSATSAVSSATSALSATSPTAHSA